LGRRKDALPKDSVEKDYRINTSLARGLSILRAFSPDNHPIGNAEIAERVRLPKATVSRLTFTLTELGYLRYDESLGRYSLGPAVLTLGYDVISQMEIRDIARPYMEDLAKYAGANAYLAAPDGTDMIHVEACRIPASMSIRLGVGSRLPMASTSLGRAYLAALKESDREALIEKISETYGENWHDVETNMRAEIAQAQKVGFALSRGAWFPESNSVAAAIRRKDGTPVYSLNIGGLRSLMTDEYLETQIGPRVFIVARELESAAKGIL